MASNNIDQHSSGGQNAGAEPDATNIDPIWTTSRTARQIYALGEVEKDISRLLSLAASSISLLTLPQTDGTDDKLPQGEERSELFVLEVSEYFGRLDVRPFTTFFCCCDFIWKNETLQIVLYY